MRGMVSNGDEGRDDVGWHADNGRRRDEDATGWIAAPALSREPCCVIRYTVAKRITLYDATKGYYTKASRLSESKKRVMWRRNRGRRHSLDIREDLLQRLLLLTDAC